MATIYGILSFPQLFTPKVAKGGTEAKYSVSVLLPPGDPQIASLQAEIAAAKVNAFPSGYTGKDECLAEYNTKYHGKDYYDARFSGWWVFSCTAKDNDKPAVVDTAHQTIIDPGSVCSGMYGWVSAGISGYTKGKGGIGGWLNGVMTNFDISDFGRLDGKPSVEQMFSNVNTPVPPVAPVAPVAPVPPVPPVPPVAPVPPAAPVYQMTEKAGGYTREQMIAQGWNDELLIAHGYMLPPNGVTPSFAS